MKFSIADYTTEAIPGILIEIRAKIVMKERSFMRLHKNCMKIEKKKFINILPGNNA